jgi:hypothetical protein
MADVYGCDSVSALYPSSCKCSHAPGDRVAISTKSEHVYASGMRSMLIPRAVKPIGSLCCYPPTQSHPRSASDKLAAGPTMFVALEEYTGKSERVDGQAPSKEDSMAPASFAAI